MSAACGSYPKPFSAGALRRARGVMRRWQKDGMIIFYGIDRRNPRPVVGFAISRKSGNAVRRNRFKRIVRHCLAECTLPAGGSLLVLPARDAAIEAFSTPRVRLLLARFLAATREREWPVF